MRISDVAAALMRPAPADDVELNGVSIDSRSAADGSLFIAIKGENHDAHQYVPQLEGRCAAAVVDRKVDTKLPCFQVADTQQALTELARYWRDRLRAPITAITGSCGKTTTRALLVSILEQQFNVSASKKSHNNAIGVPLSLLQATDQHQQIVAEVGTNFPGEISGHSYLLRPDIALILMAAPSHLAGLGSLAGVVKEKGDLLLGLQPNGLAVLNRDDPAYDEWAKRVLPTQQLLSFGLHADAAVRAEHVAVNSDGCVSFDWSWQDLTGHIDLPMLGKHNVSNALAAIAVALHLGVRPENLQAGFDASEFEPRRLAVKKLNSGATLIDDSYNANPQSMAAAQDVLLAFPQPQKILVMGDMAELGPEVKDFHHQVGRRAKELGISALYGFGQESKAAVDAFGEGATHWDDLSALSAALKPTLTADSVVLVKGSNSMGMNKVVHALEAA